MITTPRQLAQKAEFYHHLSQLTAAGIGLPEALAMHQRGTASASFRGILARLGQRLNEGTTFSQALRSAKAWVPTFDLALVEAGELSGRLPECLGLLARYYEERVRTIRHVAGDLMYPFFLVHLAVALAPLPSLVLQGDLMGYAWRVLSMLAPLYGLGLLLVYATQNQRPERWRAVVEAVGRRIPVIGTARRDLALARLAAALEALVNAGVTLIEAWDLAADASGSPALRQAVAAWKPDVLAGMTPGEAVARSREFPELFAQVYQTGEISGKLDHSLRKLHEMYQEESTFKLRLLAQWFPRLVYLGIVLVIAWRIVSFWMGYFNQLSDVLR